MTERNSYPHEQRRVALITGATGFVGSHLARRLVRDGWAVHAVSRGSSRLPSFPEFEHVVNHNHDGTTECMIGIFATVKPSITFHLASLFLAEHQAKDIAPLILSNLTFGTQLLEAMAANDLHQLVNTGTAFQHYNNEEYNPVCLYAATKQAFEDIVRYYVEAHGFRVVTLKLFDTYGSEDLRAKVFNMLRRALASRGNLEMSPGEQMLDLVFIDDVIDAYLIAADRLSGGSGHVHEIYFVSSDTPIRLKDLVRRFEAEAGGTVPINWGGKKYRAREVMVPPVCGKRLPGWSPKVELVDGIRVVLSGLAQDTR